MDEKPEDLKAMQELIYPGIKFVETPTEIVETARIMAEPLTITFTASASPNPLGMNFVSCTPFFIYSENNTGPLFQTTVPLEIKPITFPREIEDVEPIVEVKKESE